MKNIYCNLKRMNENTSIVLSLNGNRVPIMMYIIPLRRVLTITRTERAYIIPVCRDTGRPGQPASLNRGPTGPVIVNRTAP